MNQSFSEPSAEEQLAALDRQRESLLKQVEIDRAAERPNALKTAQALIDKHGFTAAELTLKRKKRAPAAKKEGAKS